MPADLTNIVATVRNALERHTYFTFASENNEVRVHPQAMKAEEAFQNIRKLASYTTDILSRKTLRQISYDERETLRDLVDCVYKCSKVYAKQFGKEAPEHAKDLHAIALSAKLGGKLAPSLIASEHYKEYTDFIQANALQHKVQALGHQFPLIPSLPLEDIDEPVRWLELKKKPLKQTSPSDPAFSFEYQGREVFRTDAKLKLHPDYTYIDGKIAKYNPIETPEVRAYDHERGSGQYRIELWTAIHDRKGERPVITLGDHAHMVLVDAEGNRYGFGQYGMADDFNLEHVLSAFGRKKGGIETPDRYLLLPKDSHSFMKTEFVVDKTVFNRVMDRVKAQKQDPHFSVSLLCGNCSTNVQKILESIGIKVSNKMHVVELIWRKCAPLSFIRALDSIVGLAPVFLKRALCFFPPFYLFTIFYGLVTRLLSMKNFNDEPSDISLPDVFLRPWKATIDHPFAVRRWQENYLKTHS